MTAPFDPVPEFDDRPQPFAAAPGARQRPSRSGRLFRWWLVLSVLAACACVAAVALFCGLFDFAPLHVIVNGDDIRNGITINGLDEGSRAALGVVGLTLALLLVLLVPLLLLLVLGAVALALACAIVVPLGALALVLGLLTSPVWLLGVLVWLIARRQASRPAPPSARMAA